MVEVLVRGRQPRWQPEHTAILLMYAGKLHDREIAAILEVQTGDKFSPWSVQQKRADLGLGPCKGNDWTAPIQRAKA